MAPHHARLVAFVGPGLNSFEQLAAGARQRGVDTAWIGYPYSWLRRMRARAFVSHVSSATDVAGLAAELRKLGVDRIADIQASEYVLGDVVAAAREARVPAALLAELEQRLCLADKLVMSSRLREAGIAVPPALDAGRCDASDAAGHLGLPLVVKGRIGNGGSAVQIVDSAAAARAAAEADSIFGGAMYEQFVAGETVSYSASHLANGQVLNDVVYVTERIGARRSGPPHRVRIVERIEELDAGRRVVDAIGGAGLVNVNLITDRTGHAWVHDVNLRPWGTLLALREAGFDFAADYLHVLGLRETAVDPPAHHFGQTCDVFPLAALAIAETSPLAGFAAFAGKLGQYRRWTSLGYVAAELARTGAIVGRDRLRGSKRKRSAPPARGDGSNVS